MLDAINKRVSTRTFKNEPLTKIQVNEIKGVIEDSINVKGPFDHSFEFTFNLSDSKEKSGKKIGTYGLIKNMPAYIGGVSLEGRSSLIDFGFVFEKIILELTELGYDTCWLGGTFKRNNYRKGLEPNEVIPAISPVGIRADKRTFMEKRIRKSAQSDKRLRFGDLFQYFDVHEELEDKSDSRFVEIMNLVRRGPSASNKQPWRFYVSENHDEVHVYLKRNEGYGAALGYDIQALDIGIALCHYEVGMNYFEKKLEYLQEDNLNTIDNCIYVISVKTKT